MDSRLQLFYAAGPRTPGGASFVLSVACPVFRSFVKNLLQETAIEKRGGLAIGTRVWRFEDEDEGTACADPSQFASGLEGVGQFNSYEPRMFIDLRKKQKITAPDPIPLTAILCELKKNVVGSIK